MSVTARSTAADLIAWYAEMGVDVALDETPADRLSPPPSPPPPIHSTPLPPPVPEERSAPRSIIAPAKNAAAPAGEIERTARAAAESAADLDQLRDALEQFEGCNLRQTATQLVFADGNPKGRVMLVGEAPGREEDIRGVPFVGRSGQLLDRMLAAIDLDRTMVYVANVVPWRPPGNRTPTPQETAACRPFIERQIALADPDFLVCLGGPATAELMGNREGILRFRGRWHNYDTGRRTIRAIATLHPAYLLRQPLQKRLAWRDFLALKEALDASG